MPRKSPAASLKDLLIAHAVNAPIVDVEATIGLAHQILQVRKKSQPGVPGAPPRKKPGPKGNKGTETAAAPGDPGPQSQVGG